MPRRFNAEISHCLRARSRRRMRYAHREFHSRRGVLPDIEPIANIEKRQSPALSDVMNTRKILLTLMSLPLPLVWTPYDFSVTVFL